MRKTSKRYTDEYKKMIIEVYNTGKPMKEICEEYGVSYESVHRWVDMSQPREKISKKPVIKISKEKKEEIEKQNDEILRLKKENERIAMENEILKKAIAIFSREQNL
jgi:transposase